MAEPSEPCGNEECDKCNPLPRYKVSTERVQRLFHERTFKAATPEEALRLYNEGSAWPASYDDRGGEIIEEHAPVVTLVVDDRSPERRARMLETFCYHNLPKGPIPVRQWVIPDISSCDACGGGCSDPECERCWPKENSHAPETR